MNFLQRLLSQPKVEPEQNAQIPVQNPAPSDTVHDKPGGLSNLSPGFHIGKLSDIGRHRERNEDSFYVVESLMHHNYGQEPFGLFVVADGMGGHQKGEVASSLAARVAAGNILGDIYLPYLANDQNTDTRPLNEVLIAAVENANNTVQEQVPDGGTTLTAALIMGNNAYIVHVGDTRVYFFKQDELKQVTKDHSLAQRLQETSGATDDEVSHVQNVLYKAIGQGGALEADTYVQHLSSGASLLLCSDGLWGSVKDDEIKEVLASASTPQEACERLVARANENGGPDNITAVIVSLGIDV